MAQEIRHGHEKKNKDTKFIHTTSATRPVREDRAEYLTFLRSGCSADHPARPPADAIARDPASMPPRGRFPNPAAHVPGVVGAPVQSANIAQAHLWRGAMGDNAPSPRTSSNCDPGDLANLNDDRIGRCLDRLFDGLEADLILTVVRQVIDEFHISLDELHNDSTTVSFHGA